MVNRLRKLWKTSGRFLGFVLVVILLTGAWFLFLRLVTPPPIDNNAVLIMIWGTLLVLILAAFPQLLERIKSIKAGDFEVELQEAIKQSSTEHAISAREMETQSFFSEKGRLEELENVILAALQNPKKNMIFVVNLGQGGISVAVLAAYLYFLNFVGKPVIVLFVSLPGGGSSIPSSAVLGAIRSDVIMNRLMLRFPGIFTRLVQISTEYLTSEKQNVTLNFLRGIENVVKSDVGGLRFEYPLRREDVENWFKEDLNRKAISSSLGSEDMRVFTQALNGPDDFVLILENGVVASVLPLCEYARHFAGKVLRQG